MRDVNFVKCVSAVIKEGDEFEMDIEGTVTHKFGKLINILNADMEAELLLDSKELRD